MNKWTIFCIGIIPFLMLFFYFSADISLASENLKTAELQLRVDVDAFYIEENGKENVSKTYSAGAGSKFYIYYPGKVTKNENDKDIVTAEYNIIKFVKVKKSKNRQTSPDSSVNTTNFYRFYTKTESTDLKFIQPYYYTKSFLVEHGILVVPFKYRTKDGALAGESEIGYYIGGSRESLWGAGTAFISAGLSQIPISDVNLNLEYKTGISIAGGIILTDRDTFQVALVIGQDHLGGSAGKDWEYENNLWISFAIGYSFGKKD
jgi:hypothetical protein